jgi:hypothetical protein
MFQFCFVEFYAANLKQILTQKFVSKPLQNISWIVFSGVEFVTVTISRVTEVTMLRMNGNIYMSFPPHLPSWRTKGQLNFYPYFVLRHV